MQHHGIIAIVFVIGCVTGGVAAQLVVPTVRAGTSPTRWEYQCATADRDAEDVTGTLNKLGAEGWELVSLAPRVSMAAGHGGVSSYMLCARRALP